VGRLFGRGEQISLGEDVFSPRESLLGLASPDSLVRHTREDLGPHVRVVGTLGAGNGETEQAAGILVSVGIEGHKRAGVFQIIDR
jgi:hypothetical protein